LHGKCQRGSRVRGITPVLQAAWLGRWGA